MMKKKFQFGYYITLDGEKHSLDKLVSKAILPNKYDVTPNTVEFLYRNGSIQTKRVREIDVSKIKEIVLTSNEIHMIFLRNANNLEKLNIKNSIYFINVPICTEIINTSKIMTNKTIIELFL